MTRLDLSSWLGNVGADIDGDVLYEEMIVLCKAVGCGGYVDPSVKKDGVR